MISEDFVRQVLKSNADPHRWAHLLSDVLPIYGITSKKQVCSFIAQTGHESLDYTILTENLNYSAQGLLKTFPKYFDASNVNVYSRNAQRIASRVYANRMGNGNEASGDGWKFRGRGILQVTGKNNYQRCSQFIFKDDRLLVAPEELLKPEFALHSACWFWKINKLNDISETGSVSSVTRIINGGQHGLDDRQKRYDLAMSRYD